MSLIDPTAYVDPTAKLHQSVVVGRGSYIGAHVEIGEGTVVRHLATILGPSKIGRFNRIFQYTTLGDEPQDLSYKNEPTCLEIGDYNVFREHVTIHRGTVKGGSITRVGNHNYFMANSHVGHDCQLGNHIILVNTAALSGHVEVESYATIGAYCGVHQFTKIGAYSFISHATQVTQDVLPFLMVTGGSSPKICGLNTRGLRRRGFSAEGITWIKRAYKLMFRQSLKQDEAIKQIEAEILPHCSELSVWLDFVANSHRGLLR